MLSTPATLRLFGDSYLPGSFTYRSTLTKENFYFPEFIDDFLWRVASSHHFNPPFFDPYSNIITGPILGGASNHI